MTIEQFHDKKDSLRNRFAEENHFLDSIVGKTLDWTVSVSGVSAIADRIHVSFYAPGPRSRQIGGVTVNRQFETRLMALGEGELIRIQGTILTASGGEVMIDGSDFEVVTDAIQPKQP